MKEPSIRRVVEKAAAVIPGIEESVNHKSSTLRYIAVHATLAGFWAALEDEFHPREDGQLWGAILLREGAETMKDLVIRERTKKNNDPS